ncbi:hypothetical protein Tco_0797249 [Tanacetum coccineum]
MLSKADWLKVTDERLMNKMEAHYSYMAKILDPVSPEENVLLDFDPMGKRQKAYPTLAWAKVDSEPTHGSNSRYPLIFRHANRIWVLNVQKPKCQNGSQKMKSSEYDGLKHKSSSLGQSVKINVSAENNTQARSSIVQRCFDHKQIHCSVLMEMMSVYISSGLVLHQMTSDITVQYSNYQTTAMIIHKVVRLGINPMIQPEPEDLPKDNPKLEIAVLRKIDINFLLVPNKGLTSAIAISSDSSDVSVNHRPLGFFFLVIFYCLFLVLLWCSRDFTIANVISSDAMWLRLTIVLHHWSVWAVP